MVAALARLSALMHTRVTSALVTSSGLLGSGGAWASSHRSCEVFGSMSLLGLPSFNEFSAAASRSLRIEPLGPIARVVPIAVPIAATVRPALTPSPAYFQAGRGE